MQTIKGLIALLLTAAAVFTAVMIYNSRTEPVYEAKIIKATLAETVKPVQQTAKKAHAVVKQTKKSNL